MRKNIQTVVNAFILGQYANEKAIHTDGTTLFSYAMPIARKRGNAWVVRAKGPTQTTNTHINGCKYILGQLGNVFTLVESL
jgi:hypothetical protein